MYVITTKWLKLGGQLKLLPYQGNESNIIRKYFDTGFTSDGIYRLTYIMYWVDTGLSNPFHIYLVFHIRSSSYLEQYKYSQVKNNYGYCSFYYVSYMRH